MKTITIEKQDIKISDEEYDELKKSFLPKRWKPVEGEEYYFVNFAGGVEYGNWHSLASDSWNWRTGNCFRAKEEAKAHRTKLVAIADVRDYCYDNDLVLECDWGNWRQEKYYIIYDHHSKLFDRDNNAVYQSKQTLPYLKSIEACEQVTEAKEKELRTIFNVE